MVVARQHEDMSVFIKNEYREKNTCNDHKILFSYSRQIPFSLGWVRWASKNPSGDIYNLEINESQNYFR